MKYRTFLMCAGIFMLCGMLPASERMQQPPVKLQWGIPEDVPMSAFSVYPRDVEGEEVSISDHTARITVTAGNSYIIPMYAFSHEHLEHIRYVGDSIPKSFQLQWLEPWNGIWYDFDQIPPEAVEVHLEDHGDSWSVDFGPPEGALFADEIPRFIWFRLTPEEAGTYEFTIHGYRDDSRVTNILKGVFTVTE